MLDNTTRPDDRDGVEPPDDYRPPLRLGAALLTDDEIAERVAARKARWAKETPAPLWPLRRSLYAMCIAVMKERRIVQSDWDEVLAELLLKIGERVDEPVRVSLRAAVKWQLRAAITTVLRRKRSAHERVALDPAIAILAKPHRRRAVREVLRGEASRDRVHGLEERRTANLHRLDHTYPQEHQRMVPTRDDEGDIITDALDELGTPLGCSDFDDDGGDYFSDAALPASVHRETLYLPAWLHGSSGADPDADVLAWALEARWHEPDRPDAPIDPLPALQPKPAPKWSRKIGMRRIGTMGVGDDEITPATHGKRVRLAPYRDYASPDACGIRGTRRGKRIPVATPKWMGCPNVARERCMGLWIEPAEPIVATVPMWSIDFDTWLAGRDDYDVYQLVQGAGAALCWLCGEKLETLDARPHAGGVAHLACIIDLSRWDTGWRRTRRILPPMGQPVGGARREMVPHTNCHTNTRLVWSPALVSDSTTPWHRRPWSEG